MRAGLIYRSAAPAVADGDDAAYLAHDLGIMVRYILVMLINVKTIIDLREQDEAAEDQDARQLHMFENTAATESKTGGVA